jgi:hypothetical protein
VDTQCPRCQQPLADPEGLAWCQACGYCRSLEEDRARLPLHAIRSMPVNPYTGTAPPEPLSLPTWAMVMAVGVIVLATTTWLINHEITLRPLTRAVWTTTQIVVGILVMLIGQSYALIRIAPEEASLHAVDAVFPFRLYGMILKRLPTMKESVWLAGWGLTLALSAVLFVGGLSHWLNYLPKTRDAQPAHVKK